MTATRRNGREDVRYRIVPCSLGWLLVAATERGICLTSLGDSPAALKKRLASRRPGARLAEDDPQLVAWTEAIVALIEDPASPQKLPLDIRGTPFQQKVWDALCAIPPGKTSSYGDVARKIGSPKAARAVGAACGSNPVAPMIPCHRVLAGDGSLGGYGFGLDRKRTLLEREGAIGD